MNRDEAITLLQRIAVLSPGMPMSSGSPATAGTPAMPGTAGVWWDLLRDVPMADAIAAVRTHYAASHNWITPADIRRRVVGARGLLPPDPEAAYAQARRMNSWLDRRVGPEPEAHPAVMAAAREISWSTFDGLEGYAHKRFVEAYRPVAEKATERALTTPVDVLEAELAAPKALPAGSGVQPEAGPRPNPGGVARVEGAIARSGFGKRVPL